VRAVIAWVRRWRERRWRAPVQSVSVQWLTELTRGEKGWR